jgi:hypothetical protein
MEEKMENENGHATRQDILQFRLEMSHMHQDLVERITDREPRLLKVFYAFAESNQKRMVEVEGNEAALRSRIGTLESRLLEVEKRLNMPPAS